MRDGLQDKESAVYAPFYVLAFKVLNDLAESIRMELASTRPWSKATPGRFKPYRVNATGKTSDSLHIESTTHGAQLIGRKDFLNVESGNAPGNRPNVADLKAWSDARGLQWTDEEAAFYADKIASQGDSLYEDGGREPFVTPLLEQAGETLLEQAGGDEVLKEITHNIAVYINA